MLDGWCDWVVYLDAECSPVCALACWMFVSVGVLVRANPNTAARCVGAVIWYPRCLGAIYAALGLVSMRACVLGKTLGNVKQFRTTWLAVSY